MDAPATEKVKPLNKLLKFLENPIHLRAALTLVLLGSWYGGFFLTVGGDIDQTTKLVASETKRLALAKEVEGLRGQLALVQSRLPEKTDANEWMEYFLATIRNHPVRLIMLDTDTPKELGPYRAMVIRMDLEGSFQEINDFLRDVESNSRLLRIDMLKLEPGRGPHGHLTTSIVVLGVMG